jgi:hypothetical protein
MNKLFAAAVCALAAVGCAPDEEEDTDNNKNFHLDGYEDPGTPAPQTPLARCSYNLTSAHGEAGVAANQIVPGNFVWHGVAPGSDADATLSPAELYDCDGSRGIHAILIDTSQFNCSACSQEAGQLETQIANWRAEGLNIQIVTLLLDNPGDAYPPDATGARAWRDQYGLSNVYVMADPNFDMVPGSQVGTPQQSVIDPRTMKVVHLQEGYAPGSPAELALEALARQNAGL